MRHYIAQTHADLPEVYRNDADRKTTDIFFFHPDTKELSIATVTFCRPKSLTILTSFQTSNHVDLNNDRNVVPSLANLRKLGGTGKSCGKTYSGCSDIKNISWRLSTRAEILLRHECESGLATLVLKNEDDLRHQIPAATAPFPVTPNQNINTTEISSSSSTLLDKTVKAIEGLANHAQSVENLLRHECESTLVLKNEDDLRNQIPAAHYTAQTHADLPEVYRNDADQKTTDIFFFHPDTKELSIATVTFCRPKSTTILTSFQTSNHVDLNNDRNVVPSLANLRKLGGTGKSCGKTYSGCSDIKNISCRLSTRAEILLRHECESGLATLVLKNEDDLRHQIPAATAPFPVTPNQNINTTEISSSSSTLLDKTVKAIEGLANHAQSVENAIEGFARRSS